MLNRTLVGGMQTVILAAGRGTRMLPLTDAMPKPMLPLGDRPLAAHVADAAIEAGASEIIFVTGYLGETVRDYFGDAYRNTPVTYVEQEDQRGTADALRAAREAITGERFAVLNGDMVVPKEALGPLYSSTPAIGATRVENPSNYGVLDVDDNGKVRSIVEKPPDPPSNLANAGAYTLPKRALAYLDDVSTSSRGEYELTDVLARLADEESMSAVSFEHWFDVGRPWELLEATAWKLEGMSHQIDGDVSEDATIHGDVLVEKGASVRSGVTLEGPVVVRSGGEIGPNAYVRGPAVIGRDARVGHAVEVKNSILFPDATVGHLSYVGDSLLGSGMNFGAGTNVANLRHDDGAVRTTVKGDRVSTGRRKFGVVVGPNVKTGIDTNLNAGIVLPADGYTIPGETVISQSDVREP